MRDKVTRQCPQTATFEKKGEPKRIWWPRSIVLNSGFGERVFLLCATDSPTRLLLPFWFRATTLLLLSHCDSRHLGLDWLDAYIALFSALLSRLTALACGSTTVTSFIAHFFNIHRSGVLTALAWLVPHETAAALAQVLCILDNHAPCHFMQSHIRMVYACLAVTCHLHFWQNDRALLRVTVVTRGWNSVAWESLEETKNQSSLLCIN